MRTKFTVSMAAAGALLATVAIPSAGENSAVRTEATRTVEPQLFAGAYPAAKRPLIARTEERNDKESA